MVEKGKRQAKHWIKLEDNKVQCKLCYRECVIPDGEYGACGVRKNEGGVLYTLVYGMLTAANVDPIEKKPLMHFYPGSSVLSISTIGCNFFCKFCQNWVLSQQRREIMGKYADPDDVVRWAKRYGTDGISYTYNEPTVFYEFMYDVAKLAAKEGLFNTMVTNGYMQPEAVKELGKYMNAATVDFKGGADPDFYRKFMGVLDPEPIFDTIIEMKRQGWWIEITNLVVPIYGDKEEYVRKLARWINENLGPETPFHLLRFHPDYLVQDIPPTPVETLEKLAKAAAEEGLKHVYLGNVPGHPMENTYCPNCGELVVERYGFYITNWKLKEGNVCPKCGYKLNIVGEYKGRRHYWLSII